MGSAKGLIKLGPVLSHALLCCTVGSIHAQTAMCTVRAKTQAADPMKAEGQPSAQYRVGVAQ